MVLGGYFQCRTLAESSRVYYRIQNLLTVKYFRCTGFDGLTGLEMLAASDF